VGALFAILSAVGFGLTLSFIQLGLRGGRVTSGDGMMISLIAGTAVLVVALAVSASVEPMHIQWQGVAYFVLAGLMAPLFGRGVSVLATERIGSTRAASLGVSEAFIAAPLAYLFLDQGVSQLSAIGIVVIAVGTVLFINESRRFVGDPDDPPHLAVQSRRAAVLGVAFGLSAGLFFAMAGIFRQMGVDAIPSALVGSAIGSAVALVVFGVDAARRRRLTAWARAPRRPAAMFALSGLAGSFGNLTFLWALDNNGTVAVSTAIKNTSPIFTFLFAAAFMARRERIGLRLGLLVLMVAAGAVLAALGRG